MPFDWDCRPVVAGRHNLLLDRGLECIVEGGDDPVRVLRSYKKFRGYWITGAPELYGIIINGIAAPQHFAAGIGGVALGSDELQDCLAACFIITMQNMLPEKNIGSDQGRSRVAQC